MKKIFALLLMLLPLTSEGAATRIQAASATTGATAASTLTFTWGSNLTVGNWVVVVFGHSIGSPMYCSTGGLVGSLMTSPQLTSTLVSIYVGRVTTATNSIVFTSTTATASDYAGCAAEYKIANPKVDTFAALTGTSTSPATGSITTSVANELLIGGMVQRRTMSAVDTAWLTSVTGGFTSVIQTSTNRNVSNVDRVVALVEQFATSTGTYSAGGTSSTSAVWNGMTVGISEVQFKRVFGD